MKPRVVFFDDGGVLSDNAVRAREWQRLVGEFLTPRLGGDRTAWGEANRVVYESWLRQRSDNALVDFFNSNAERERWLREMCEHVGVRTPSPPERVSLAKETQEYVFLRVRAAFPEAANVVRALAARYTLATASSGTSRELEHYLTGMGVRDHFSDLLYGPDLVQTLKDGPRFYQRIFAHAVVAPGEALVVDDSPQAIAWATEAGARAVLVVRESAAAATPTSPAIRSLAELPPMLESTA